MPSPYHTRNDRFGAQLQRRPVRAEGWHQGSTTPPELAGPIDDGFVYRLTKEGEKALAEYERTNGKPTSTKLRCTDTIAEALGAEDWRERKRRRRKEARKRGHRFLTVCDRSRGGRKLPDLRMTGQWLEAAGFTLGQEYEVEVAAGRLTLRAI
jgi:hypothetical protein